MDQWHWAQGQCTASVFEEVSALLFELGVQTLEEMVPDNAVERSADGTGGAYGSVPPPPREDLVHFKFYAAQASEIESVVQATPDLQWTTGTEAAQDWDLWWRERQTPVSVSDRLWVRPPWVDFVAPSATSVVLEIEAKTAFGTGEHFTTSLCAKLLEGITLQDLSVLDIGTGTGILAMFAEFMGARICIGTEIDPQTLPCMAENFVRNNAQRTHAVLGGLETFAATASFDVVLCNMIRSEVWPLRSEIRRLCKPGGSLILSGQLAHETAPIHAWFKDHGWTLTKELVDDEWWACIATLQNSKELL